MNNRLRGGDTTDYFNTAVYNGSTIRGDDGKFNDNGITGYKL
jgi:hypothetical protein